MDRFPLCAYEANARLSSSYFWNSLQYSIDFMPVSKLPVLLLFVKCLQQEGGFGLNSLIEGCSTDGGETKPFYNSS